MVAIVAKALRWQRMGEFLAFCAPEWKQRRTEEFRQAEQELYEALNAYRKTLDGA
jgi:hypothetical protein